MTAQLRRLIAPPQFDDDLKNRTAVSLTIILYALFIGSLAGLIIVVFSTTGTLAEVVALGVMLALMLTFVALLKAGRVSLVSQLVPLIAFALIVLLVLSGIMGIRDISAYGLMVVLPLAALLLGRRGAVLYALAVAAAFTGLYIIEKQGLIASPVTELNGLDDLAELYIYVGVAATVLWMLVTNLSKTLDRVRVQNTELQRTQAELQALNTQLEARVAERTEELRAAKEAAEAARDQALAADRLKSQFLASMSHELRTPLNAVLSFNKLLKLGTFGEVNDEQVEYLGKSIDSATHLLALINDVLDVTKIQSGMMKLFIEEDFDLNTEIASMADTAEKMLDGKPVTLIREIDAGLPTLTCDKRRVRQILLNLVSNAIKFTEEGSITLRATHTGDSVTLAVIDTGPGITPEQTEYIFEPFVQTEEGIKHAGGTGLGLPISKKLAEAHGGRLWVESTPGAGAAFHVRLPLTPRLELGEVAI